MLVSDYIHTVHLIPMTHLLSNWNFISLNIPHLFLQLLFFFFNFSSFSPYFQPFFPLVNNANPRTDLCHKYQRKGGRTGRHCLLPAGIAAAKSLQPCPTLRDPIDGSPPGSPIPGILQARTLEWVAISSNAWKWKVKVKLLSRVRLPATMDCSLPGSSVHGIFQSRALEWVTIAFSPCKD